MTRVSHEGVLPSLPTTLQIGRPVRVVSFSFRGKPLDLILELVGQEGAKGSDIIVLPETWRGQNDSSMEGLDGPTITRLARLAKKYGTYIVSPIDLVESSERRNTAVLVDRQGQIAGTYHKVFPYWAEFDQAKPVVSGREVPVFQTDFGKLGLAICFDVNFPELWQGLADGGAELVLWSSAYSAGSALQAHALNHHYYIVTSTQIGDCQVYDITGQRILDERANEVNISRITLDLDRGIYHQDFNVAKRDKLLMERSSDVVQDQALKREAWFVLKAIKPGVSARGLAREYGLEELRHYIHRSRRAILATQSSR